MSNKPKHVTLSDRSNRNGKQQPTAKRTVSGRVSLAKMSAK